MVKCPSCENEATRVRVVKGRAGCDKCWGLSELAGPSISGILTRNADRIVRQREKHAGDFVVPHTYDKASGKVVPSSDFIKLYPGRTSQFFEKEDIERTGDKKLTELWNHQEAQKEAHERAKAELAHGTTDVKGDSEKREKFIEGL